MGPSLIGKTAIVTGASSGIGHAVAVELARRGVNVAIVARDYDRLQVVAREIGSLGVSILPIPADVADPKQVEAVVQTILEQWKQVDILVNNAGFLLYGSVDDCTPRDFERQIAVNYLGAVYFTKAVLPLMLRQSSGSIVNVSSISSRIYLRNNAAYQASKAALRAFTLTLRQELASRGIGVSLVTPGRTRTEIIHSAVRKTGSEGEPLLGEMRVERVARLIVDCAEHPTREVVLPLILRPLLATYTIWPDLVERCLPWLQRRWGSIRQRIRSLSSTRQ